MPWRWNAKAAASVGVGTRGCKCLLEILVIDHGYVAASWELLRATPSKEHIYVKVHKWC